MDVNHIRHLRLTKKGVNNLQGLSGFGHNCLLLEVFEKPWDLIFDFKGA